MSNLIFGIHAIEEAIIQQKDIDKIFVKNGKPSDELKAVIQKAKEHKILIKEVPEDKLNGITRKNHQGILAFISPIQYHPIDEIISKCYESAQVPFIIALDKITDVRNFGGIARTAHGLGVHAILIPAHGSVSVSPDAVKTSAGALLKIPICRVPSLPRALEALKEQGLEIIAITEKSQLPIFNKTLTDPLCLILGNEDDGISRLVEKISDVQLAIPMMNEFDSFNVNAAANMAMYEVYRQRF